MRTHPLTCPLTTRPGQIVGWVAGRPVRAIAGASPEGDGDAGDTGSTGGDSGDQGSGSTGDSGSGAAGSDSSGGSGDGDAGKAAGTWDGKIESLPSEAQKLIERYKNEAANASAKSRDNARKEAEQELLKKLGLVKGDEKPNPDELAKQLTAAQQAQKQATVELAVFRTASKHQGDPNALLDSRSFLAKVADLDPSASGFEDKVSAAIKDAVTANTKLKAGQASGKSSVDHTAAGGGGRSDKPKSITDAVASHYGT